VESSENARRVAVLIHTGLAASIGVYAVLLLFIRSGALSSGNRASPSPRLFIALAAIGLVQFAAVSWVGRSLLRSRRSGAAERVRLYFLLRASAAEAIAIFGLLAGFRGAPLTHSVALFAMSLAALLVSAPSRPAWEQALRTGESPGP
jgi:hypothetical protein